MFGRNPVSPVGIPVGKETYVSLEKNEVVTHETRISDVNDYILTSWNISFTFQHTYRWSGAQHLTNSTSLACGCNTCNRHLVSSPKFRVGLTHPLPIWVYTYSCRNLISLFSFLEYPYLLPNPGCFHARFRSRFSQQYL